MEDLYETTDKVDIVEPDTGDSQSNETVEEPEIPEVETETNKEVSQSKDEFDDWNKEKSVKAYRELQRKIQEREEQAKENEKKAREEYENRIRLEEQLRVLKEQGTQQSQPEKPKEPPVVPPRPQKPANYKDLDPYDPDKLSYDTAFQEYLEAKDARTEWENSQLNQKFKTFEELIEEDKRSKEQQKQRAEHIYKIQQTGVEPEKAVKVYEWLASKLKEDDPSLYVKLYDLEMANDPSKDLKTKQAEQRGQRQRDIVNPASLSNEAEPTGDEKKATPVQADYSKLFETY